MFANGILSPTTALSVGQRVAHASVINTPS